MGQKWNQPVTIPLANVNPDFGSSLTPGLYAVKIGEGEVEPGKEGKAANVVLPITVIEGEARGLSDKIYMNTDFSKGGVNKHWRALAESVGIPAAQLDANPNFVVQPQHVIGQSAFVYVTQDGTDEKGRPNYNRTFVSRTRAAKLAADIKAGILNPAAQAAAQNQNHPGLPGAGPQVAQQPVIGAPQFGAPAAAPQFGAPQTQLQQPAPQFGLQQNGAAPAAPDLSAFSNQSAVKM